MSAILDSVLGSERLAECIRHDPKRATRTFTDYLHLQAMGREGLPSELEVTVHFDHQREDHGRPERFVIEAVVHESLDHAGRVRTLDILPILGGTIVEQLARSAQDLVREGAWA